MQPRNRGGRGGRGDTPLSLSDFIPESRDRGGGYRGRGDRGGRGSRGRGGRGREEREFGFNNTNRGQEEFTPIKERGKVSAVQEEKGYGFITSNSSGKRIFYHISDVEDHRTLKEKDDVEYTLVRDFARNQEMKAVGIRLLGRLLTEKDSEQAEEKKQDLPQFMPAWMQKPKEQVSSQPAKQNPELVLAPQMKSSQLPTRVKTAEKLREGLEGLPLEKGIVASVHEKFGFIKCYGHTDLIFYHINEAENRQQFQEGDEVEFFLIPDSRTKGKELKATSVRYVRSTGIYQHNITGESPQSGGGQSTKILFQDKRYVLDWMRKMSNQDGEQLLLHISDLENLLNQDELPFSVIQPLIVLLTRPDVRRSDRTDKIYTCVLNSKFLRHPRNLRSYILHLSESKKGNDVTIDFKAVVDLMEEMTDRLQTSYTDLPLDALNSAAQKIHRLPTSTSAIIAGLLQIREQRRSQMAQTYSASEWTPKGEEEDFRDINVFPTTEEIFSVEAGQLSSKISPNIVNGKYKNVMHYLDTHYRLLREDCLQPLREGIRGYIATKDSGASRDIRVYHSVRMKGILCNRMGIVYRISFKVDCDVAWERSKRLMYGSLLCLSCDDFKTLLWATVANRDASLLSSSRQIDIRFPHGHESEFTQENVYTMVESSTTYFEAYQHVLKALQSLDIDDFPFADYLISCKPSIEPPLYLKPKSDVLNFAAVFDGGKTSFSVLQEWPRNEIETTLDESQMKALQQALTKEFAIIQGPPGTGKTFCGLKVMRALLDNHQLRKQNPILIVCYTNHALDQFLEGVFQFEENLVRIGGQSKSEILQDRNIRKLMYESGKTGKQHHRSRYDLNQQLNFLQEQILQCVADLNSQELTIENIRAVATPAHVESLLGRKRGKKSSSPSDIIKFWLTESAPAKKAQSTNKDEVEQSDKSQKKESPVGSQTVPKKNKKKRKGKKDEGINPKQEKTQSNGETAEKTTVTNGTTSEQTNGTISHEKQEEPAKPVEEKNSSGSNTRSTWKGNRLEEGEEEEVDDEIITQMQADRMVGEDDTVENQKVLELKEGTVIKKNGKIEITEELLNCDDVWSLTPKDRYKLYCYWVQQHFKRERDETALAEYCAKYEELCHQRRILEEELQIEVLSKSRVIGMTTTGVAKFQKMIQAVQPEVIIVEEAAEVLEAHIVAALSPATKHLILIGDHEQLRPSTAVYQLSVQYHLDVSLFERLVRNGVEQVTLLKQRRMRPAISALIAPIYPNLIDHQRVTEYPNVMGVSNNIFFINHHVEELSTQDSSSKSNPHEAEFLSRFCNYLLLQGYKSSQITVLTGYSGQVFLLRKEFKKLNLTNVRITSVDNFQGEENDIILLSLVRSNKAGSIGFLTASNRVCVALSRAKIGLYVIGNGSLLSSRNDLWRQVIETFKKQNAFGNYLTLRCQNHPSKFTPVAKETDFKNAEDGGCNQYCRQTLECGHTCPRFCHPYSHDQLECNKPCNRKHEKCNHTCTKRCFEDCGACDVVVEKVLENCGHKNKIPCYFPADEYVCTYPCEKLLSCKKHPCPRMCGENCSQFCHVIVEKDLKCGHAAKIECGEDAWKYRCAFPCLAYLDCGHKCIGTCTTCNQGKQHIRCSECK